MRNRIVTGAMVVALLVLVGLWAACGNNSATNAPAGNQQSGAPAENKATDNTQPDKPTEPDNPNDPDPEPEEDLGEVPKGEVDEHGLIFTLPFERGDGSAVLSRQNDYLRVELDVRLPYSGGDGQRIRGSSVDLVLSVDGLNGRHLFFYPQPLWYPSGQGRMNTYRMEASYSSDKDGPPSVVNNPSFVGEGDVEYWDRWTATLWVDLRYVLVPGNSPGSQSDTWLFGLIVGNETASEVLPKGLDRFNPGKTPDRMIQFKFSELPELDALDEDPKDRLVAREEALHEHMKNCDARAMMQDHKGIFDRCSAVVDEYPEELWAHNLRAKVSHVAAMNKVEGVDHDYLKYEKAYVEAGPGQSSAHIGYLQNLLRADQFETALEHTGKVFESELCTGRALTGGHMRLEWAKMCTHWGHIEEAEAQLKFIDEHPDLLDDDRFRVEYKRQKAELAQRRGDSAAAVEIYDDIFVNDSKHLDSKQTRELQQLANLQRAAKEHWQKELEYREADKAKTNPRLVIETSKGKIVVELFEDDAPNTTASLVSLAQKEFWDGLNFHRVEPNFVAQGGCPNGNGSGGPGYRTRFERNDRRHFRGSFAMARSQDINSQGSQFYICVSNGPSVVSLSDADYLVVGRVIDGMNVADTLRVGDEITSIRAENLRDHEYVPETLPE